MRKLLKKIIFVEVLLFLNLNAFAPDNKSFDVLLEKPVNPFLDLIHAIGMVETKYDTLAYNPLEEATGYFQIRPIRLADYNKKTCSDYKLQDMYNYNIAEKIFLYYASMRSPYDLETIARRWNGSGEMTTEYWKKVRAQL